jgi:hypothetical protein
MVGQPSLAALPAKPARIQRFRSRTGLPLRAWPVGTAQASAPCHLAELGYCAGRHLRRARDMPGVSSIRTLPKPCKFENSNLSSSCHGSPHVLSGGVQKGGPSHLKWL